MPKAKQPAQRRATVEPQEAAEQAQGTEEATPENRQEATEAVDVAALRQELAEATKQSQYHLDQWKRSAANLDNYRKRVEKERADLIKSAKASVIGQLLPVLDDFERAFMTIPFELSSFTWMEGLALVGRKLQLVLEQQGLEEIKALGEPFDPTRHQALLQEETEQYPDGHVMAILQKGYKLGDRILRPALVKVARRAAPSEEPGSIEGENRAEEGSTDKGAESIAEDSSEGN